MDVVPSDQSVTPSLGVSNSTLHDDDWSESKPIQTDSLFGTKAMSFQSDSEIVLLRDLESVSFHSFRLCDDNVTQLVNIITYYQMRGKILVH